MSRQVSDAGLPERESATHPMTMAQHQADLLDSQPFRRDMADREHVDAVQVDPVRRRNAVWYSVAIAAVIVGAISIWRGLK